MRTATFWIVLAIAASPTTGNAELSVPDSSAWYFHADFAAMRNSDAGRHLYGWLQREVFDDVHEDAGINLDKEADTITAFSGQETGAVILVDGEISQDTKDKALALAAGSEELQSLEHRGRAFYFARNDIREGAAIEIDSFEGGVYFSFALEDRVVATSTRKQMQLLLDSKGELPQRNNARGALVVLSAEKGLVQAGMQADQVEIDSDGGWQSNVLQNTEQVALMIADLAGKVGIEAQLIAKQPEMAESLASIVRGLISLTMLSDDMDPEIARFLKSTSVDVDGSALRIRLSVEPESLVSALED